jgi:3-oxoacyl-[acyl-carrier-protein] synthase III
MSTREVHVIGMGSYLPGDKIPFHEIERLIGRITDAPPRIQRSIDKMGPLLSQILGIEYAHYAIDPDTLEPTETSISMAVKACRKAMSVANIGPADVDLLIYAGTWFDRFVCPPSSVLLQEALGIPRCAELTIQSNCTAAFKALQVAADLLTVGRYRNALVAVSQLSSTGFRADRFNQKQITKDQAAMRWFLSDGASAVILCNMEADNKVLRIIDTYLESPALGVAPGMEMLMGACSADPRQCFDNGWHHLGHDLEAVVRIGPAIGGESFRRMIEKTHLEINKVKQVVYSFPAKAIRQVATQMLRDVLNSPTLEVYSEVQEVGFTGPPGVLIGLERCLQKTNPAANDWIVCFGTESSKWMSGGCIFEYCLQT